MGETEETTLGAHAQVIAGQSPEGQFYNQDGNGLPFYQGKKDFGDWELQPPTKWTTQVTKEALPGDILMSVRAPVGPVNFTREKVCIGRGLAAIRCRSGMDAAFLFYQLLGMQDRIAGKEGAVFASINKAEIEALPIAAPPLSEQRRIVAILDEAFEAIATAKANTERKLQNARELFDSQLQLAFTLREPSWPERALGELGTITSSKRIFASEYTKSGVPFFRTKEVKQLANGDEITTELYISDDRFRSIRNDFGAPKVGDLLLTAIGTIGEIYVVDDIGDFYFKDGNVLWLKDFKSVSPHFLKYALQSFVEGLNRLARGSAYSALPINKLNSHRIVVPPEGEQRMIVERLDELKDACGQLETLCEHKVASLDELKKSLLHQAFTGQLTSKSTDQQLAEAA